LYRSYSISGLVCGAETWTWPGGTICSWIQVSGWSE